MTYFNDLLLSPFPEDPVYGSFARLGQHKKDMDWLKWLIQSIDAIPDTFLPSSKGLIETHKRLNTADTNKNYPNLATHVSIVAANLMRNSKIDDFEKFYNELGLLRGKIAKDLKQESAELFGRPRSETQRFFTPIGGLMYGDQYKSILTKSLAIADTADVLTMSELGKEEKFFDYPFETPQHIFYHTLNLEIKKNEKPLTTITVYNLDHSLEAKEKKYIVFEHLQGKYVKDFLRNDCAQIFNTIQEWKPNPDKSAEENEKEIYKLTGLLAWHLAHACPFSRGSCATTDMLVKAILLSKNIIPKSYKPGVNWDFKAMCTPNPEDFANRFYFMFEHSLEKKEEAKAVVDDFQADEKKVEAFESVLQEKKSSSTHEFKHQHLMTSQYPHLYFSFNREKKAICPSIHRGSSPCKYISLWGYDDYYNQQLQSLNQIPHTIKNNIPAEKFNLIKDQYADILYVINDDFFGFRFDFPLAINENDIIDWINEKSPQELKTICQQSFLKTIEWLEKLPQADRSLLQEEKYTRQQIRELGIPGLERQLRALKGDASVTDSLAHTGLFKSLEHKEPAVSPHLTARMLARKLKYRAPINEETRRYYARVISYRPEAIQEQKADRTHTQMIIALQKFAENKEELSPDDREAIQTGQKLFVSLQNDFNQVIACFPSAKPNPLD